MEYVDKFPFRIKRHPEYDLQLDARGIGSEPHVEFSQSLLQFDPVLPFSQGSVAEVTITNPTPYPIEIYSLEYDKQYVIEEEVWKYRVLVHHHT